jgi:hypothetical protein
MFKFIKKVKERKESKKRLIAEEKLLKSKSLFDVKKPVVGEFDSFLSNFKDNSLILLITGIRGGCNTALGMKFVELC